MTYASASKQIQTKQEYYQFIPEAAKHNHRLTNHLFHFQVVFSKEEFTVTIFSISLSL